MEKTQDINFQIRWAGGGIRGRQGPEHFELQWVMENC